MPGLNALRQIWSTACVCRLRDRVVRPDPHLVACSLPCRRRPTGRPRSARIGALIFLTARPMPGPPDDGRRRAMANRPLVSNVRRRSLPHTLPARRQVRQHYAYIRVCAESCECLGLPTKREHGARSKMSSTPGCCSDSRRTGAQGASGVERAGTPARAARSSLCLPFHRRRQLGC